MTAGLPPEQRNRRPLQRGVVLAATFLAVLTTGCAPATGDAPAGGASPPPPKFLFNQTFPSDSRTLQATVDQEVYPPHYAGLWHTHPGYGMFCTLQGTLTIEVEGKPNVPLPAGRCWEEVPGVAHRPANLTTQQAVALFYLIAPGAQPRIAPAATPTPE